MRESTGKTKEKEAETFLKQREGALAEGRPISPRLDKIRYEEARGDLVLFYETTGRRKLVEVRGRLAHLDAFFRGARLADITSDAITKFIARRQAEDAANGTVNREVGVLLKMAPGSRAQQAPALAHCPQAQGGASTVGVLRA